MGTSRVPLFSIITICRNHLSGLCATAASISTQDNGDYEWIVIDGASTDGTLAYLQSLNHPQLRFISEPDGGIYDAMNKGMDRASGDYLLFLNAGDVLAGCNVLTAISFLAEESPDFIYGDSREGIFYKKARNHSMIIFGMFTHHQAMFYRRTALGGLRYLTTYKIAADYDLTLRFLSQSRKVAYYNQAICIFEQGGISQRAVTEGRKEQYRSRAAADACNPILNKLIYLLQSTVYFLRRYLPHLYWAIKR